MSVLAQDQSVSAGCAPAAELQGHGDEVRSCFHSEALGLAPLGIVANLQPDSWHVPRGTMCC